MTFDVDALAAAAAGTDWQVTPPVVRSRVLDLTVDVMAVAALGSTRPELLRLADVTRTYGAGGTATVVGRRTPVAADAAAYLNGCAVAADQLQDGHRLARGHPASHVVPAVFALAETDDLDSAEMFAAVIAGYEVGVRIGRAMGGTPAGVHDIGTWGQVAVSAGVARLLAPGDVDVMRRALDLSAAAVLLTDAATVFTGHSGSHLFLGSSIRQGLGCGLAAVAGFEPEAGAIERHLAAVAAADWHDPETGHDDTGWTVYEVLSGYLKDHPTCAHLHGVNDAIADLIAEGVRGEDIDWVDVRVAAGAGVFSEIASSELAARFSVPTSVAVALVTGRLDETTMTDVVVRSESVQDLARRVIVRVDAGLDAGYPAGRPARVEVLRRDGRQVVATATRPRWDADRVPAPGELRGKAERLFGLAFGEQGRPVCDMLEGLAGDVSPRDAGVALREASRDPDRR